MRTIGRWAIFVPVFFGIILAIIPVLTPFTYGHLHYVINGTEVQRVGTGLPYSLETADQLGLGMLAGLLLVSTIQLAGPKLSLSKPILNIRKNLESMSSVSTNLARALVSFLLLGSWYMGSLLTPQFGAPLQAGAFLVWLQLVAGSLLLTGLLTPLASVLLAITYLATFTAVGVHGLDHIAILGLVIYFFIEGSGKFGLDSRLSKVLPKSNFARQALRGLRKYSLLALRVTLGVELVWLGLTEKILAPALTSYAIVKYGVPYFPDLTVFTFVFGVFEVALGFHFVLGLFNRVVSVMYLGLLLVAVPIFGEWINHFYLFAAVILLLTRGAGKFRVDVRFIGER